MNASEVNKTKPENMPEQQGYMKSQAKSRSLSLTLCCVTANLNKHKQTRPDKGNP
jgi:hypothetical protein